MIKVGIVGAGGMGTVHYHNYRHLEDCEVAGVVTRSPAGKAKAAEKAQLEKMRARDL